MLVTTPRVTFTEPDACPMSDDMPPGKGGHRARESRDDEDVTPGRADHRALRKPSREQVLRQLRPDAPDQRVAASRQQQPSAVLAQCPGGARSGCHKHMNDAGAGGARAAMTNACSACNPESTQLRRSQPCQQPSLVDPSAADPSAADPSAAEPAASHPAHSKILCTGYLVIVRMTRLTPFPSYRWA